MGFDLPIFDLIRPLHIVNVHPDLVLDVTGQRDTAGANSGEHNASPELPVVQQLHGFVDEPHFCCYWFQLVQVDTLKEKQPPWELWGPDQQVVAQADPTLRGKGSLCDFLCSLYKSSQKSFSNIQSKLGPIF